MTHPAINRDPAFNWIEVNIRGNTVDIKYFLFCNPYFSPQCPMPKLYPGGCYSHSASLGRERILCILFLAIPKNRRYTSSCCMLVDQIYFWFSFLKICANLWIILIFKVEICNSNILLLGAGGGFFFVSKYTSSWHDYELLLLLLFLNIPKEILKMMMKKDVVVPGS